MKRFIALFVAPVLVLLALEIWPLVSGAETLILRDVLNSHLGIKAFAAQALRSGELPLVDPLRAGGQALIGNLNAAPLYPDNFLFRVAPKLWALNAHFWLHWVAALFGAFALGRALGLSREGSWAGAVAYALSGYFASQMNLYNLVAGAALAPALAAAAIAASSEAPRRWHLLAVGVLWSLLLLAGDPMTAGLALVGAALAVAWRHGRRCRLWAPSGALAAGTLVAAPQLVELARVLPLSFRGHWGYGEASAIGGFDPRTTIEWLMPLFFGRPDVGGIWGEAFFGDKPPLFFTLYPGLLVLAGIAISGRPTSPAGRIGWSLVGVGFFFALGSFNPLAAWLYRLPGAGLLRYPIKAWLLVALGVSLLFGVGFERLSEAKSRRRLGWVLLGLGMVVAALWLFCGVFPGASREALRGLIPENFSPAFVERECLRFAGLSLLSLMALAGLSLALFWARRQPRVGSAALLLLHAGAQLFFLRPALPTDETRFYQTPPALLAHLPADSVLAHGAFNEIFRPNTLNEGHYPGPHVRWLERRAYTELYPFAGMLWGRRYELNYSPEGLDPFLVEAVGLGMKNFNDLQRLRVLAAFGVDLLLVDRLLDPAAAALAPLRHRQEGFGQALHVYEVPGPAREVEFATTVLRAPHVNAALEFVFDPRFDPRRMAILPGEGPSVEGAGGLARLVSSSPERFEIEIDADSDGVLILRRAYLPHYRATVDGVAVPTQVANLTRLAVAVPAGHHQVRVWFDRRPFAIACAGSLLGLVLLALLAWRTGLGRGAGAIIPAAS